ncbi:unnamed protein product [Caenorhabditis bovis]|uniref:Glutaredoxin-1 n=1 Tax=Caenorhabditis bovis TaxID=2654633 RepID=A0A8S1F4R8_9PELO|nr:unnamed protein product [Caenorhabditis bovis]
MSNGKGFVDGLLKSHKVVVFSKSYCPYCHKARSALDSQNIKPDALKWVEIDERPDCDDIQNYLGSLTGARSVPRVFIGGKFFGGGDDTAAAAKNGKLAELLKNAEAL